jgi:hypothetical protein
VRCLWYQMIKLVWALTLIMKVLHKDEVPGQNSSLET